MISVVTSRIMIGLVVLLVAALFIYAVFFTPSPSPEKVNLSCEVDTDCVPDACCHPTRTVNKEHTPFCLGIACTAVCAGPLDCGCGEPACMDNVCTIRKLSSEEYCP